MKSILSIALILAVTACNSNYSFKSNLDPAAIEDYFTPSEVTVYHSEQLPLTPYESRGFVEGNACQMDENGVPVTLADARTEARRAAAAKQANGLVIKKCVLIDDPAPGCFSNALCIGEAIKLLKPTQ